MNGSKIELGLKMENVKTSTVKFARSPLKYSGGDVSHRVVERCIISPHSRTSILSSVKYKYNTRIDKNIFLNNNCLDKIQH